MTAINRIARVAGVVYVHCDPKTCSERIRKRARTGESEIPIDYL
jgi:deoxyadenosine/deoxycytidine kinase